jgi:acyl dehydratase
MPIAVGDTAEHRFVIGEAEMKAFAALSSDQSSIHVDDAYARSRGFERAIVYGGLMLAQLSRVLGSKIPGDHGVSTSWTVHYRRPLYVGEPALLRLEVTHTSPATGVIEAKFAILRGDVVLASGSTQSIVPRSEIAAEPG